MRIAHLNIMQFACTLPHKVYIFALQIIKQSQVLLNFLAVECRITNEHVQCMWAAGQVSSAVCRLNWLLILIQIQMWTGFNELQCNCNLVC